MNPLTRAAVAGLAIAAALAGAAPAAAQEATHTPAATSPSVGKWYFRQRAQGFRLDGTGDRDGITTDKLVATSNLAYGVTRTLSLSLEVPAVWEEGEGVGLSDLTLLAKWRPLQWDLGPVDSVRVAFFGGAELPSGDGDFSSHSVDPLAGAVVTAILGRHGFNQSLAYKLNLGTDPAPTRPGDGEADALRFDTAYLYRLAPAAYSLESTAATYLTLEANGLYETNGDVEVLAGPGLLYEARGWAAEVQVAWPVWQEVRHRDEVGWTITVGIRVLF